MFYMIILAFSLSVDAIGIGLSYGVKDIKIPCFGKAIICTISFLTIFLSMSFGELLCRFISEEIGKIIGSIVIFIMGLWIIFGNNKKEKCEKKSDESRKEKSFDFLIKPLGISVRIIKIPEICDLNKSSIIEPIEAIYLGIALSFDAIGIGVTSSAFGFQKLFFSILVCMFQILFLSSGLFLGKLINQIKYIDKISNIFSGGILIVIAILKLF